MTQVFISYSRNDMEFVQRLAEDLQHEGLDVWWDISDIQGSDVWERKIEEGLNSSQYFIVVLTPASLESRWVRREYLSADNKGIKIIPLKLKTYDEVPLTLRDIQPVDAVDRPYENVLSDVLKIVSGKGDDGFSSPIEQTKDTATSKKVKPAKAGSLELIGTLALLAFFLSISFMLLSPSSNQLQALTAISGLAAGIFLLWMRRLPTGILFKTTLSIFFITYDLLLLNNSGGWDLTAVEFVAGIPAVLTAIVLIVSMQRIRTTVVYGAMLLAVFVFLISIHLGLNALGLYPSWPHIPTVLVSVLTAVLIWMEM